MIYKIRHCTVCGISNQDIEFYKRTRTRKDGTRYIERTNLCMPCQRDIWHNENQLRWQRHKEKIQIRSKEYYAKNRNKIRKHMKKYYLKVIKPNLYPATEYSYDKSTGEI